MPTSPPYVSAQVNEIKREQFEIVSEGLCTNGFYGGRKFGTTWRITMRDRFAGEATGSGLAIPTSFAAPDST
jgi:hypothetical protein